jgi:hypothetical protein
MYDTLRTTLTLQQNNKRGPSVMRREAHVRVVAIFRPKTSRKVVITRQEIKISKWLVCVAVEYTTSIYGVEASLKMALRGGNLVGEGGEVMVGA